MIVAKIRCALAGKPPVFTSDELWHYKTALVKAFGRKVEPGPSGRPGRPRLPYIETPSDFDYATVHKRRENGVVVEVSRQQQLGDCARTLERLKAGPSSTVNTSFVERTNLNWRLWDAHLSRKSSCFAKSIRHLKAKFSLCVAHYNFGRPHESLSRRADRSFVPTTPAMAAGILSTPWKIRDMMLFAVCRS